MSDPLDDAGPEDWDSYFASQELPGPAGGASGGRAVPPQSTGAIKSTGHSSSRFGNCEVCGLHCSDVFIQGGVFGHEDCLKGSR
jgi:hypothetical protein